MDDEEDEYVRCRLGMLPLEGFEEKSGDVSELSLYLLLACLTREGLTAECVETGRKLSLTSIDTAALPAVADFSDNGDNDCKVVVLESNGLQDV